MGFITISPLGPEWCDCNNRHQTVVLPIIFSNVILTPSGVRSGRPLGNPSTGWPWTCLPSTATSGLSENLSAGVSCCLDTRGRWLGDSLSLPARLLLGPGVDLIWISWMMLRVPGVDTLMGFARTKLVPDSSAWRDLSVSSVSSSSRSEGRVRGLSGAG